VPSLLAERARSEGARSTRAVEDQSDPIPEERTSELGGMGRTPTLVLCSRNAHDKNVLVRRPHRTNMGALPGAEKQASVKEAV